MTSTHPLILGLVLLCIPIGSVAQSGGEKEHPVQDAKEVARILDERVRAVDATPAGHVWQDAEALASAVQGADSAAIDPLFEARLARTDLSERARLMLVGTRLSLPWPGTAGSTRSRTRTRSSCSRGSPTARRTAPDRPNTASSARSRCTRRGTARPSARRARR